MLLDDAVTVTGASRVPLLVPTTSVRVRRSPSVYSPRSLSYHITGPNPKRPSMSTSSSMMSAPILLKLIVYFTLAVAIGLSSVVAQTEPRWTLDESRADPSSSATNGTLSGLPQSRQSSTVSDIADVDSVPNDLHTSPEPTCVMDVTQKSVRCRTRDASPSTTVVEAPTSTMMNSSTIQAPHNLQRDESNDPETDNVNHFQCQYVIRDRVGQLDGTSSSCKSKDAGTTEVSYSTDRHNNSVVDVSEAVHGKADPADVFEIGTGQDVVSTILRPDSTPLFHTRSKTSSITEADNAHQPALNELSTVDVSPRRHSTGLLNRLTQRSMKVTTSISLPCCRPSLDSVHVPKRVMAVVDDDGGRSPARVSPDPQEPFTSLGRHLMDSVHRLAEPSPDNLNVDDLFRHVRYLRQTLSQWAPVWRQFPNLVLQLEWASIDLRDAVRCLYERLNEIERELIRYCSYNQINEEAARFLYHRVARYVVQYRRFRTRINAPGGFWIPTHPGVQWKPPFTTVTLEVRLPDPPQLQMVRLPSQSVFQNRLWNILNDNSLTIGSSTHDLNKIRPTDPIRRSI